MDDSIELHADLQALLDDHLPFAQRLHAAQSLAPLAAQMAISGEIIGAAFTSENAGSDNLTADDAIGLLTERFMAAAARGEIRASAIFFHGYDDGVHAPLPAQSEDEANCIVVFLDHRDGQAVAAVISYRRDADARWSYAAPFFKRKKPLIFGERS
jgi:hypothetical protein